MTNYFKIFSDLINEIISVPDISLIHHKVKSGYDPRDIKYLAEELRINVPASIIEFYSQLSTVEILWSLPNNNDSDEMLYGEISIVDMIAQWRQPSLTESWKGKFDETNQEKYADWINRFCLFDFFNSDEAEMAGLLFENTILTEKVAYHKEHIGFIQMNLTFNEYINFLTQTRGMMGWQSEFINGDIAAFLKDVNKIFSPGPIK